VDKLTYFKSYITIVEKGSLKNAADFLNLTPSAVSKHLSTLEQYYDIDLAIRDAKSLRITGEGRIFYDKCKQVLASLAQAEEPFLSGSQQTNSVLRITLSQVLSQGKFMQMLSEFSEAYPQIKLDIVTSNKNLDLVQEDIDFAFRGGKLSDSRMRSIKLFQASTMLCAQSNISEKHDVDAMLNMIADKLIIPSYINLSTLRTYLSKIGINKSLSQFSAIDDAFSYKSAILSGMGIGIFLDFFVQPELDNNTLWQIKEPHAFGYKSMDFYMVYHKNIKLAKSHEAFKQFVINFYNPN